MTLAIRFNSNSNNNSDDNFQQEFTVTVTNFILLFSCRCETEANECESSPCDNNSTCIDLLNGFECNCTANYTGVRCEIEVRPFSLTKGMFTHTNGVTVNV